MSQNQAPSLPPKIYPLGDSAIVLEFGKTISREILQQINSCISRLKASPLPAVTEYVPAYTTLTIYYDPLAADSKGERNPYEEIKNSIYMVLNEPAPPEDNHNRQITIPVCYGGTFGQDLEQVAKYNRLSPVEVITIHTANEYLVYMVGFAPGFPYLGGMDKRIATPRKSKPGLSIPPGSTGIAGEQTGIYPLRTPGGWQLIGRTPLKLFNPQLQKPALLQAGDKVRFTAITEEEFEELKNRPDGIAF